MTIAELLADSFGRIRELVHETVDSADASDLSWRPDNASNSIAWLTWHLTRIQDDHIADAAKTGQVWIAGGWAERFGLPFDEADTGYGHGVTEVAALQVDSGELLTSYHDAVYQQTLDYISGLTDADLDRVVDERWDPPVTLGVRLVSVISDDLQHVGQAAYLRGLADRR
jgi:uncharacterized damage-inducible protein DinB